jgi:hypothetical protein
MGRVIKSGSGLDPALPCLFFCSYTLVHCCNTERVNFADGPLWGNNPWEMMSSITLVNDPGPAMTLTLTLAPVFKCIGVYERVRVRVSLCVCVF